LRDRAYIGPLDTGGVACIAPEGSRARPEGKKGFTLSILLCQSARRFRRGRAPFQEENPTMPAAKKAAKKTAKKSARKPNAAFMKAMQPSAALAKVVGEKPLPRTEVVKKIWAYVKRNGLQDKKEKRNINADDTLREIFGGKRTVSMFEMTKLVNDNLS
jgi:chromatin remodeling complex protein RSC6